jgi:hypothetical protein
MSRSQNSKERVVMKGAIRSQDIASENGTHDNGKRNAARYQKKQTKCGSNFRPGGMAVRVSWRNILKIQEK